MHSWICISIPEQSDSRFKYPILGSHFYWLVPQGLCSRHYLRLCPNTLRFLLLSSSSPPPQLLCGSASSCLHQATRNCLHTQIAEVPKFPCRTRLRLEPDPKSYHCSADSFGCPVSSFLVSLGSTFYIIKP